MIKLSIFFMRPMQVLCKSCIFINRIANKTTEKYFLASLHEVIHFPFIKTMRGWRNAGGDCDHVITCHFNYNTIFFQDNWGGNFLFCVACNVLIC